ncbi:MAG: radical SAM protein [Methanosphaera sp.]|nr:radical SAM protein [Methanosphaera sp.]
MHYVNVKSILSNKNGMNLYRGCTHGCIYCDSRSSIYNMNHDFEDVEVKANSLELLRKALKNKKDRVMVGMGSMSDPYMPLEDELKYTRGAMELVYKYSHGFTCITKSDLILRDFDLLKKINEKSKAVVQMTLTCMDDELSSIIEPNVCTTTRRLEVLSTLRDNGIPTVAWLTPVLPYITDNVENISTILDECIDLDVKGIICFGMGMTLRDKNRQHYYRKLDEQFPGLKERYVKEFGASYAIRSPNNDELMKLFYRKTGDAGIMNSPDEIFKYLGEYPGKNKSRQTRLFTL